MLSQTATQYLSTLERRPSISTREVQGILRERKYPQPAPWIDFHDRYAGYVELLGKDWAVWGLAHDRPYWLGPREVEAEVERGEASEIWTVTCADVHPSYEYTLDQDGVFSSEGAESFDIKVEQNAVRWSFARRGAVESVVDPDELGALQHRLRDRLMEPASDKFSRFFMDDEFLLIQRVQASTWQAWRLLHRGP